jgi:hypothetical protein
MDIRRRELNIAVSHNEIADRPNSPSESSADKMVSVSFSGRKFIQTNIWVSNMINEVPPTLHGTDQ